MKQNYENYYKEYYQKNKEKIKKLRQTKYREKINERNKSYYKDSKRRIEGFYSPEYQMWYRAKYRAKNSEIPFEIEVEDIIIPKICPILGVEITLEPSRITQMTSPSLDKVNPHLGYIKGNIQVISHKANVIKRDMDLEMIEKLRDYVIRNSPSV